MSRAATKPPTGRAAGAQSVKAMLLAIGEAEDKFNDRGDEIPPPALLVPIVEAHVAAANGSGDAGFRGGFYEALAEWLAPTVSSGTICDAHDWSPLGHQKEEAPSVAVPVAAPPHVTTAQAALLFEQIASIADTARNLAMQSLEAAGQNTEQVTRLCAVDKLCVLVGSLAESAIGEGIVGSLADWTCGPLYREAGR